LGVERGPSGASPPRIHEHAGLEVLAAPTGDLSREAAQPGGRLALARLVAREVAARLYYRLSVPD